MGEAKQSAIKRAEQILLMVSSEKLIIIQIDLRTDRIGLVSSQMSVSTLKLGSSAQTVLITRHRRPLCLRRHLELGG